MEGRDPVLPVNCIPWSPRLSRDAVLLRSPSGTSRCSGECPAEDVWRGSSLTNILLERRFSCMATFSFSSLRRVFAYTFLLSLISLSRCCIDWCSFWEEEGGDITSVSMQPKLNILVVVLISYHNSLVALVFFFKEWSGRINIQNMLATQREYGEFLALFPCSKMWERARRLSYTVLNNACWLWKLSDLCMLM